MNSNNKPVLTCISKQVSIKEVIITTLTTRGDGSSTPIRVVTQIFTKGGELIAEHDPLPDQPTGYTYQDLESLTNYFAKHINALDENPQRLLSDWMKLNRTLKAQ